MQVISEFGTYADIIDEKLLAEILKDQYSSVFSDPSEEDQISDIHEFFNSDSNEATLNNV